MLVTHQCFLIGATEKAGHITALLLTQHDQWLANTFVDKDGKVLTYSHFLVEPVLKDIWEKGKV